ncbi:Hypothetical_protein [Hexamita inflata]|uniref:Hypothetical_protein n=1 Tax=Hexamita inflata TaxID=28002 RepID=A0AA86Q920_9EUKA|nr:Hypothetical protein HINF_LOCUS40481 [Hexamita inflata]
MISTILHQYNYYLLYLPPKYCDYFTPINSPPLNKVSIQAIDLEQQNKYMQKIVDQMLEQVNQSFEQHISLAFAKLRTQISGRQLINIYNFLTLLICNNGKSNKKKNHLTISQIKIRIQEQKYHSL